MSASAMLHQLIGQTLQSIRQRAGFFNLQLSGSRYIPAANQLDDPRGDADEFSVFVPYLAEQFRFVSRDKLQPIQIVSELVQLTERRVQHPIIRHQERGRNP